MRTITNVDYTTMPLQAPLKRFCSEAVQISYLTLYSSNTTEVVDITSLQLEHIVPRLARRQVSHPPFSIGTNTSVFF